MNNQFRLRLSFLLIAFYKFFKTLFHHMSYTMFGFSSTCHHQPSCSVYLREQINKHGTILGSWRGLKRIISCLSLPKHL